MRRFRILVMLALLALPVMGLAQVVAPEDIDAQIAELDEKCPISNEEGWVIRSFTTCGDTARMELQVPHVLAPFLAPFLEETVNVKNVWKRQLKSCGEDWKRFRELLVQGKRYLDLVLLTDEENVAGTIHYEPAELK